MGHIPKEVFGSKELPPVVLETKISNTTYVVTACYASQGVTVSDRISHLLSKKVTEEIASKNAGNPEKLTVF